MNTHQQRALIAVGNITLILLIAFVGFRTFKGTDPNPEFQPPKSFDPLKYAPPDDEGPKSSLTQFAVVWRALDGDRFKQVKPKQPIVRKLPVKRQPTVQDLSRTYVVDMVTYNANNPKKSSVTLSHRHQSNKQLTISIDGGFDGYTVEDIQIAGDKGARKATITLSYRGKRHKLELKERDRRK